jgi:mono/diheme cytochrome c family protein
MPKESPAYAIASRIDRDQCLPAATRQAANHARSYLPMNPVTARRSRFVALASLSVCLLTGAVSRLHAQDIGDAAAGRQLSETWCSTCHVVSPAPQRGASTGAPTFAAIARMKTTTPLGLRAFLQTPHDRMPDLHLSREEIDDVASYILSLRRR